MLLAKKILEAEARTLGPDNELTGAQLADHIKKTRERLLNSMRAQLTSLEQAIEILPAVPSIIQIQALESEWEKIMSTWRMSGELTKRIQETEISSFHDVNNAQDELDTRITEPLEKLRKDIIAKRIECKVLLEEAAAAERLHKMLENRSSKYFLIQCWCEKSCPQQ